LKGVYLKVFDFLENFTCMFRHGPVSGLMTPEKLSKPVPVEITAMERLQMEMRMYEGYMEYLDTRPPDEAPPTTPIRKPKGQVFNGFQGLPNFSVQPL
jgi:hypothetical protein